LQLRFVNFVFEFEFAKPNPPCWIWNLWLKIIVTVRRPWINS